MNHKKQQLLLLVISVFALLMLFGCLMPHETFTEHCTDANGFEAIIMERSPAAACPESKILFNDYPLFYDSYDNVWYYSLVENDKNALTPSVMCGSSKINIAFAANGSIDENTIAVNEHIPMLIYNDHEYWLTELACSTLPIMNISCGTDEISDSRQEAHLYLFDNRAAAQVRNINLEIDTRVRGKFSRTYPKKGFRLWITETSLGRHERALSYSLLGLREDDDYLLYAGYNDQEKIRNVFSSNLWYEASASNNSAGIDLGMEYRYVELFVNGRYWGLYALGFPVDNKQANLRDGEFLYYKRVFNTEEREINDFGLTDPAAGYSYTGNDKKSALAWKTLNDYYAKINGASGVEEILDELDTSNIIDYILFQWLVQDVDGLNKHYRIAAKEHLGKYSFIYAPWDLDATFGNSMVLDAVENAKPYSMGTDHLITTQNIVLMSLLEYADDSFIASIQDRYNELRAGAWSDDNINTLIDRYEEKIFGSGAFVRDLERWPDGWYADPDEGLDRFREFVLQRLMSMDAYIADLEPFGHRFIDGFCAVCGAASENHTGVSVSPTSGNISYLRDGAIDLNFSGIAKSDTGKWLYFENGEYCPDYTGAAINPINGNRYFVREGIWDTAFTGAAKEAGKDNWYYMQSGVYDPEYTGLAKTIENRWIYMEDGVFTPSFSGAAIHPDNGNAYYVLNGNWNVSFTGIAALSDESCYYYFENGIEATSFSGEIEFDGAVWQVNNGIAVLLT